VAADEAPVVAGCGEPLDQLALGRADVGDHAVLPHLVEHLGHQPGERADRRGDDDE
jgi:hypothetical protein